MFARNPDKTSVSPSQELNVPGAEPMSVPVVEAPADRLVGHGGLFGTIQEDSYQELAVVVMQRISTVGISIEVQLQE